MYQIEKREYGPESSPEVIEALRARVYKHTPNIIYWKEVPLMSVWQVAIFEQKLKELSEGLTSFALLIDLTESSPPNAEIRKAIRDTFLPLSTQGLEAAAAFTDKNFFINVAAKFVLGSSGLNSFSVHSKQEDAEQALSTYA